MLIKSQSAVIYFFLSVLMYVSMNSYSCSLCKITINGNTYLGNNEDSWRLNSRIWFETAKQGKFGAVYVGYGELPQGGMNEAGLAFDGLTTFPKPIRNNISKKDIRSPEEFVKTILQTCATVYEVNEYAEQYNRQKFFNNGEYFFADKSGNYLILEADTFIIENESKYLIANFCPSITREEEKVSFARYQRGKTFLSNHGNDTTEQMVFSLTDTMHECRERLGEGTLYSFVADLNKGNFTLWFYHDFEKKIQFNLQEELKKGNHVLHIPSLFPLNKEYQRLMDYKIPQNSIYILSFLYLAVLILGFSLLYMSISLFKTSYKITTPLFSRKLQLVMITINTLLIYYIFVLIKNQEIFYSTAPYRDDPFTILNVAAYIPFALLIASIFTIKKNIEVFNIVQGKLISKLIFTLNNTTYFCLVLLFAYWGFYNVI